MSASIAFSAVLKMLEKCAPGFTHRLATHSRIIPYNGKTYRSLPKHDKIEIGHIRKMVRSLKIDQECAETFLDLRW